MGNKFKSFIEKHIQDSVHELRVEIGICTLRTLPGQPRISCVHFVGPYCTTIYKLNDDITYCGVANEFAPDFDLCLEFSEDDIMHHEDWDSGVQEMLTHNFAV